MEFINYYNRENIIKYLCKIRISYSTKRHKKQLLDNLVHKSNHLRKLDDPYDNEILEQLNSILPSRRLWLTHNCKTHFKSINPDTGRSELKKIETDDKNKHILFNTIKRHSKNKSKYPYQYALDKFITEIQEGINNRSYKISTPDIVPEVKEVEKSKKKYWISINKQFDCRPISRFALMDRIVISITNKFLTDLLDVFFEENSLAFRAKNNVSSKEKNHHYAINEIIAFKNRNLDCDIFVAECDIKKFYDTVNHNLCFELFDKLMKKSLSRCNMQSYITAVHIFKEYLDCYNFTDVVLSKNGNSNYWSKQFHSNNKQINGIFPWVEEEIKNDQFYKKNPTRKIGVPQGGALSGLIANILLDDADKKLIKIPDLFYVRYCDDMILMHKDETICKEAIDIYKRTLNELLFYNHPFNKSYFKANPKFKSKKRIIPKFFTKDLKSKHFLHRFNSFYDKYVKICFPNYGIRKRGNYHLNYQTSLKSFWDCKSKGPYKWGKLDLKTNTFPWIGFVGYEINYKCETRIRKRSLNKEILKQKKVITSILKRISKKEYKYKTSRNNTIYRSALEKLNGMSVGRVKPYNYITVKNKICWSDGFQGLNYNKHSRNQLRKLDRHKYKTLHTLRHKIGNEKVKAKELDDNSKSIFKLGKMFSYHYHAGEKKIGS